MADTKHVHTTAPVEGDGVSYSGIVWFIVILTATTIFCQLLVWGAFELMAWRVDRADAPRSPVAAERAEPAIDKGRVVTGTAESPRPSLLVSEPVVLDEFRTAERAVQSAYEWVDRNAGTARIPIDRAKALVLERGLPTREGAPASAAAGPPPGVPAATVPAGTQPAAGAAQ